MVRRRTALAVFTEKTGRNRVSRKRRLLSSTCPGDFRNCTRLRIAWKVTVKCPEAATMKISVSLSSFFFSFVIFMNVRGVGKPDGTEKGLPRNYDPSDARRLECGYRSWQGVISHRIKQSLRSYNWCSLPAEVPRLRDGGIGQAYAAGNRYRKGVTTFQCAESISLRNDVWNTPR